MKRMLTFFSNPRKSVGEGSGRVNGLGGTELATSLAEPQDNPRQPRMALTFNAVCTIVSAVVPLISNVLEN